MRPKHWYISICQLLLIGMVASCDKDCESLCREGLGTFDRIENTSLDEWDVTTADYDIPLPADMWATLNPSSDKTVDGERAPATVFRVSGDSAFAGHGAMIRTGEYEPLIGLGKRAAEGVLTLGTFLEESEDPFEQVRFGHTFQERPLVIRGVYKYFPVEGDSAIIEFQGREINNDCACGFSVVANEQFIIREEVAVWDTFELKITYDEGSKPNALSLTFSSSGLPSDLLGNSGSTLFIDELKVNY